MERYCNVLYGVASADKKDNKDKKDKKDKKTKHRKNCECCPRHSLFKGHNVNVNIVVLKDITVINGVRADHATSLLPNLIMVWTNESTRNLRCANTKLEL